MGACLRPFLHLAKRDDQPLYLVILELINFGQIQQRYGDTAGDTIMQQVEQCLRWMFRSSDIIDRWSDSAFVIGIYGMTKRNGERRLAEVLKVLNQRGFTGPNGTQLRLSFRTGTAEP